MNEAQGSRRTAAALCSAGTRRSVGATGEATVAVGLGANVLVGGSIRSVALQPLSATGQTGLNLAVGVADLQLLPR